MITQTAYPADDTLPGRSFMAGDGVVVVTAERTAAGLYVCERASGRRQPMAPATIAAALARSEIVAEPVEDIIARSRAATEET